MKCLPPICGMILLLVGSLSAGTLPVPEGSEILLMPVNEEGPVITGPGGQLMLESAHPASVQDEGEEADPSNAVIRGPGGPAAPLPHR